jgi:hypothetical protein
MFPTLLLRFNVDIMHADGMHLPPEGALHYISWCKGSQGCGQNTWCRLGTLRQTLLILIVSPKVWLVQGVHGACNAPAAAHAVLGHGSAGVRQPAGTWRAPADFPGGCLVVAPFSLLQGCRAQCLRVTHCTSSRCQRMVSRPK